MPAPGSGITYNPQTGKFEKYVGTIAGHGQRQTVDVVWNLQCEEAIKSNLTFSSYGYDEYGIDINVSVGLEISIAGELEELFDFDWDELYGMITVQLPNLITYDPYGPIHGKFLEPDGVTFEQVFPNGPMLNINSPLDGFATNSSDVTVEFSVVGGTPPYKYEAMVDGPPLWPAYSEIPGSPFTFHNLPDGPHTIYIKVIDANDLSYISFVNVTIDKTPPPAPVANPIGGVYNAEQTVVLSDAEADVSIYFTIDGTTPTTASTLYTEPINIGEGTTALKAIAVDAAGNVSPVMSETYVIQAGPVTESITLHLTNGWNLISVPFNVSVSALGANVTQVLKWNGSFYETPTSLVPGVGYLINHTGVEDVTVSGTATASPFTLSATAGYMLIGDPFEVPVAVSSISGTANIVSILKWNGSFYETVPLTGNLVPGVGYLIQTSDAGTLIFQRP